MFMTTSKCITHSEDGNDGAESLSLEGGTDSLNLGG